MRDIKDYQAADGTLRMKDGDGGDAAMKTAMQFNGQWPDVDLSKITQAQQSLFLNPQTLVRCKNDTIEWHRNPKTTSRDQTVGWFILLGKLGNKADLWSLTWAHIKRFGFCQNWATEDGRWKIADYLTPDIWGVAWRGFGLWFLYPLLIFTDLFTLVDSCIHLYTGSDPDDVGDDQNHIQMLDAIMTKYMTPVGYFANLIYYRYRPVNYGCFLPECDSDNDDFARTQYDQWKALPGLKNAKLAIHPVRGAMWWYHRTSQGAPPMWQFWDKKINQEVFLNERN